MTARRAFVLFDFPVCATSCIVAHLVASQEIGALVQTRYFISAERRRNCPLEGSDPERRTKRVVSGNFEAGPR
jgi:hypothetical protein